MKRDRLTAYHEAGHAIMCCMERRRFHYVTIEPTEDSIGHVKPFDLPRSFRPDVDGDARTRYRCEREAVILMSGHAAECVFCGQRYSPGAWDDWHRAVDIASYLHCGSEVLEPYLRYLFARTKATFKHNPMAHHGTKLVAAGLLQRRRLDYREVRLIYRDAGLPADFDDRPNKLNRRRS